METLGRQERVLVVSNGTSSFARRCEHDGGGSVAKVAHGVHGKNSMWQSKVGVPKCRAFQMGEWG